MKKIGFLKNRKTVWLFIAAILFLTLVSGAALLTKDNFGGLKNKLSKNEWKRYENPVLGFRLSYPESWVIDIGQPSQESVTFYSDSGDAEEFIVSVESRQSLASLKKALGSPKEDQINLNGQPATKFKIDDPRDQSLSNFIAIEARGKLYLITGNSKKFDLILSSLSFFK